MSDVRKSVSLERWRLAEALRVQFRIIGALMRREMRAHFGESRLGYLWAVLEPLLHLIVLIVLFDYILVRRSHLGGSMVLFMVTGLMPYFFYYKLATYVAGAVDNNRALLRLPPVKPLDVIVSRALLETATYVFVGFLLLIGLALAGESPSAVVPYDGLALAAAIATATGLGFGIGCINAVVRIFVPNWPAIFGLLLSPIFLLSGIWFLPDEVPQPFRGYLLFNPLMHVILWVRSAFYRGYEPADLDRTYASVCALGVVIVGIAVVRLNRHRLLEE